MKITAIQFIRPYGQQEPVTGEINDIYEEKYKLMEILGGRITMEHLGIMDRISVCIEHPDLGDFSSRIVKNGPEVAEAIEEMLEKFTADEFNKFKAIMSGELDRSDENDLVNDIEDDIFGDCYDNT